MTWLALIKLLLTVVDKAFTYAQQRRLINDTEVRVIQETLDEIRTRVQNAVKARDAVAHDAESGKLHSDDGFKVED